MGGAQNPRGSLDQVFACGHDIPKPRFRPQECIVIGHFSSVTRESCDLGTFWRAAAGMVTEVVMAGRGVQGAQTSV